MLTAEEFVIIHERRKKAFSELGINHDYRKLLGKKIWFEVLEKGKSRGFSGIITAAKVQNETDSKHELITFDFDVSTSFDLTTPTDQDNPKQVTSMSGFWYASEDETNSWLAYTGGDSYDGQLFILDD